MTVGGMGFIPERLLMMMMMICMQSMHEYYHGHFLHVGVRGLVLLSLGAQACLKIGAVAGEIMQTLCSLNLTDM